MDLPRLPIQQRDVVNRRILGLESECDGLAVMRPEGAFFANIRSVCQVYSLAPFAGHGEQVPQFVSATVLLIHDPLAIRRPRGAVLTIIRLRQLQGPTA